MKAIFLLLFFFFLLPQAQAISFGSFQKEENLTIEAGQSKTTEILVWNSGNSSFYLEFKITKSQENVSVEIVPDHFLLDTNSKDAEIVLAGRSYKAKIVKINFKTQKNAKSGEMIITAIAKLNQTSGISVSSVRDFRYNLEIKGGSESRTKNAATEVISEKNLQDLPISTKIAFSSENIVFALAAVLILLISFLIYKFS
jgi:uncharacterized membrane protein